MFGASTSGNLKRMTAAYGDYILDHTMYLEVTDTWRKPSAIK